MFCFVLYLGRGVSCSWFVFGKVVMIVVVWVVGFVWCG